ncbi:hypothetical protein OR1_03693 [Geobacter sp. OR-1]|uniref:AAA family ATPase n=1 Tax=Geobacter sp. OR-1 TaxID=1266765 RepID=UPI00054234D8|nr:AAA family ATPase [Geobacter sp. OR-1]GAM11378.1 hypothetical protein OR1_03693 [Geobacter sp. OR-1]
MDKGFDTLINIIPSETLYREGKPINLNSHEDQARINSLLVELSDEGLMPELIIIDNLSSMTAGGDENSNNDIESLLKFMTSLRHKGFAVVLVHHSGKSGDQRGASRREDLLDTTIKLSPTKDDGGRKEGASFTIEFTKCRGKKPDPFNLPVECLQVRDGVFEWVMKHQREIPKIIDIMAFIRDAKPTAQKDIVEAGDLGSKGEISKRIQAARSTGYIEKSALVLTKKGLEEVERYLPESAF